jgi:rhodanese-related sulfurtransferase
LAQKLRDLGYENAWALEGGFQAWQNAGLPVQSKRAAA